MKQKLILIFTVIILCCAKSFGQSDWWGMNISNHLHTYVDYRNTQTIHYELVGVYVNLLTKETMLKFEVYKSGGKNYIRFRVGELDELKLSGSNIMRLPIKSIGGESIASYDRDMDRGFIAENNERFIVNVIFDGILPLNPATFCVYLDNYAARKWNLKDVEWNGLGDDIIKKYYGFTHRTNWTETSIKQFADSNNDRVCGIYRYASDNDKIGCVKEDGIYKLIWLGTDYRKANWNIGDCFAILHPTAAENTYKADYLKEDMSLNRNIYVTFSGSDIKVPLKSYHKVYPANGGNNIASGGNNRNNGNSGSNTPDNFSGGWSGSGFALNKGYLATNYHVVEDASVIKVFGVKGNFNVGYNAKVIITDKVNDLAVLKIDDSRFQGFGAIPYRVKTSMAEVGESCFVLGYPMTMTMGSEIKLTTGVVSARSGFQGDVSLYQISAPIQPGNSGGPCFDNSGNLVGIVNAKHKGAENVSYAIKASYLQNLVESSDVSGLLPQSNTVSGYALQGKVKSIKNFVFYIRCK